MDAFILNLLNSPEFQLLVSMFLVPLAVNSVSERLKALKAAIKGKTHEEQLLDCLEKAFFETERALGWKHDTEAIYESFFGSLMSFSGSFNQATLEKIFRDAAGADVTDRQIAIWVDNVKKQISLEEHTALREYLKVCHIMQDPIPQSESKTNYILTSSASIFDNPEIICRDEFIGDLLQLLSSGHKRLQITGMGGLGKTETLTKLFAKLAADKEHSSFDHIAFIRFSGDILSDIESQIDYPRQYLGLQGVEAAKRFLHDICVEKNVLLCIDDIRANQEIVKQDNPSIQYLRSLGAYIALSARAGFPDFERKDLDFLSTKACIDLFEKKYGRSIIDATDAEILTNIIENRAGNHTLIINRLGNMAKDYRWSILILAERLKEKDFSFQKGIADEELLQQELNKLYQFNDDLCAAEKNILEAFSIFPTIPLVVDLCVEWLHEDANVDSDTCALILKRLAEKTWLEERVGSKDVTSFVMHQLVRTAVQEQVTIENSKHQTLVENCTSSLNNSTDSFLFLNSTIIIPFAISIFRNLFQESRPIDRLSSAIASYYFETAIYTSALKWFQKTLAIREAVLGRDHPVTGSTFNNIASIFQKLGKYDLALEWYQRALISEENHKENYHISSGTIYNNIASVYSNQGKYRLALESCYKSLIMIEKEQSIDHPITATTYNNIASIYGHMGKYDLALEWHQKALLIREKVLGKYHPDTAETYNNIASVYNHLGKNDLALEWYKKALFIVNNVLGEKHPNTASAYNNVALVYSKQEQYDLALEYDMKALAIRESVLTKNHPDTANSYNNIALVYHNKGEYDLALEWYGKALVVREQVLGNDHPNTATTYNNIAGVYHRQGKYDLALEWNRKALIVREKVLGNDHPDTAITNNNIAMVYYLLGDNNQALAYFNKALDVFKAKLGQEHPHTVSARAAVSDLEELIAKQSH